MENRRPDHSGVSNGDRVTGFGYQSVEQGRHTKGNPLETLATRWCHRGIGQQGMRRFRLRILDILESPSCPRAEILIPQRFHLGRLQA